MPAKIFLPTGRSETVSSMLVVAAAWAFYGAAIGVPIYFIAGVLATSNLEMGLIALNLMGYPVTIGVIGLTLFFWFRITLSVLELSGAQVFGISIVAIIAEALLLGFFSIVFLASP